VQVGEETSTVIEVKEKTINLKHIKLSAEEIVKDYRLAFQSRQASLLGRREVMSGKAKFGIFGDGKEVPQLAMGGAAARHGKGFSQGRFSIRLLS
jgi:hypothetical protein